MSSWDTSPSGEVELSRQVLMPAVIKVGDRDIETTFLGGNDVGQPTWVLWNAEEPYLIGLLRKSEMGYIFEQRTSQGVMVHQDVSFKRVQRALLSGR